MKFKPTALFLISALALSHSVTADETEVTELPPMRVQPARTEARLPTFSTSTTRLDSLDLQEREAHHLQDALGMVPNLNFAGGTSRPRYLQLRGVGERSQFASEGPPNFSVGVLFDEIDLSGFAGAVSLFDVQQVDVLRGPQATVYGSKALAGLILMQSTPPTPFQSNRLQLSVGTDDYFEAGIATGGPWSPENEDLTYRLTLHALSQDGFRDNVFLDRSNTNRRLEFNGRFQLHFEPHADLRHELTLLGTRHDNGYDAFAPRGDGFTMFTDEPGRDALSLGGLSLRSFYQGADSHDLISITSATRARSIYSYDADWGNDEFWAAAPYFFNPEAEGYRYSFTERLDRVRNQASQEFRFQGKPDAKIFGGRSAWSLGVAASWLEERDDYVGFSALRSDYQAYTGAGYGQLTTDIAEGLQLVTSLRQEFRGSDYSDSQDVDFDTSDWMTGGRVALEAKFTPASHGFVGISRGFKGGGVNANPNIPPERRAYDPETIWNLEAGVGTQWDEGQGYLNLTLFHMWRRDVQIGTSIQPDPSDPTTFTFFTDNAAEGTNYGLELEGRAPVNRHLAFFASLGLLETEIKNFQDAGGRLNIEGREQSHAPSYTFRVGTDISFTENWFARVEVEGKDQFHFSNSHDNTTSPYELVHASFGYRAEAWSLTFWGRNILDTAYDTRGFFFGLEPPDFPSRLWTMKGDPAQFGLTYRLDF
ncbi:MAG: TonB-dependent receptor [Verrucomicrobia bacterium]|nr:TonB-dependent receptor [Verrucomicrobiota bacterium]MCH8512608.1 TonB-dependent receptor [Kiritimatiellia bacterium]